MELEMTAMATRTDMMSTRMEMEMTDMASEAGSWEGIL